MEMEMEMDDDYYYYCLRVRGPVRSILIDLTLCLVPVLVVMRPGPGGKGQQIRRQSSLQQVL